MKTNTAEGASASGQTLTAANSGGGSGDAFATVSPGTSATLTYDSSAAFSGQYGYLVTKTAGNASQSLAELREGAGSTSVGGTLYVRPGGSIANDASVLGIQIRSTTDAVMGRLQIGTGDVIKIYNQSSLQLTGTVPLTLDGVSWYRLELDTSGLGSTGTWTGRVYSGHSQTPIDTITGSVSTTATLTSDRLRFGNLGSSNIQSFAFDDPRINAGGVSPGPTGFSGTLTLSGSGTLAANGTPGAAGTISTSGAGALSPLGTPGAGGTTTLSGTGTLAGTGRPGTAGALALSGAGTLAATGRPAAAGALALSGIGTLVLVGGSSATGTLTLSGSGALAANGTPGAGGALALSGAGTLQGAGGGSSVGSLNTSGAGTLAAAGAPATTGPAGLSGAGTLAAAGAPAPTAALGLSGTGTLQVSGVPSIAAALGLSGAGTLQATGGGNSVGQLQLSGAGGLQTSGTAAIAGAAGLSGLGALSLLGTPVGPLSGALALSGGGTLATSAALSFTGSLQLGSIGYLRHVMGVQVGWTPSNEMVAVAWLKQSVPYLGNRVATELPSDNSSWSASGFTTVATTGGTPNVEVPVNEPVMSIDNWGVSLNSGRPPWNLASVPAEEIKIAAVDHGTIPKILTMPAGYNQVRVFSVVPRTEPRRVPGDGAGYAHYQQDLEFRWVRA